MKAELIARMEAEPAAGVSRSNQSETEVTPEKDEFCLPQASDVETREPDKSPALQAEYAQYRKCPGGYAIPSFTQNELGVHPGKVFRQMLDEYPVRKDAIDRKVVGWVDGANQALHFRGNPIRQTSARSLPSVAPHPRATESTTTRAGNGQ